MEGLWITLISLGVTLLFVMGLPIFLIISLWVVGVSLAIDFTLANIGVTLYEGLNFFGLLALPLFILTGDLINKAGIAKRMSDFAYAVLGWVRGGMGMSALGACGMFAAISGSNSATTATIGSIMHPEMTRTKYDENFAAATVAAGGTVGIIIPPSIIFIVYGFLLNLSISDLFLGGMIPGLLMVLSMQFACWYMCHRFGWGEIIKLELGRIIKSAIGAWLGFFAIGLVVWGIYTGKFSPTEAAGVTAGFCMLVGLFMYPFGKSIGPCPRRHGEGDWHGGVHSCTGLQSQGTARNHPPFGPDHGNACPPHRDIGRYAAAAVAPWRERVCYRGTG